MFGKLFKKKMAEKVVEKVVEKNGVPMEQASTGNAIFDELLLNRDFKVTINFSKLKDGDIDSALSIEVLR